MFLVFGVSADMTAISQKRGFYESESGFYGVWEEIGLGEKGVLLTVL
jgi:hypothetical protein